MKKLLIVESPTKARTITKFLGNDYIIISSFGHIRDLPKKKMGVDTENGFEPTYIVADDKKKRVSDIRAAAKKADEIYLATDEDREGEAIAWHIAEVLGIDPKKAKRITFHEITKHAIEKALEKPHHIDHDMVNAQQARRILDRLVGYELSPFLWKKVQRGLSAGRVQSVAVRIVVDRERERLAFKQDEYWSIEGLFGKDKEELSAKLIEHDGKKLKKLDISNEEMAMKMTEEMRATSFVVDKIEKKTTSRKPPTPLRTSVLQQEANNKLSMSAKQAMTLAQKLYETGRITYMRTDSLNLSDKFLTEAQAFIGSTYGEDYAKGVAVYKTKSKGAQEAHEAIRPTDVSITPEMLEGKIDQGQWKLYDLIWRRTVASQMPSAKLEKTAINLRGDSYIMRANGSSIVFDGFMKIYRSAKESFLPELEKGTPIETKEITPKQHFTEPPPRFSDATLIKTLEEHGIGRPSTYAPTLSTIENRGYIERDENKKLKPTDVAMIVNDVLVEHFASIVDFDFTAQMEKKFDEVAEGKLDWVPMLESFYTPFHKAITDKSDSVSREDVMPTKELGKDPETGKMIYIRTGRFGSYVQLGDWSEEDRKAKQNKPKSASLPKGYSIDTMTIEEALKLFSLPRVIGKSKEGEDVTLQLGPYGPYMKSGKINVSLPEEYDPITISNDEALQIFISGAKERKKMMEPIAILGEDPNSKNEISVKMVVMGHMLLTVKQMLQYQKGLIQKT